MESQVIALPGDLSPGLGQCSEVAGGEETGATLCHRTRSCSGGGPSIAMRGFHGYCLEAMFLSPLGFMTRVGVSFPSLVVQVVGPVSTYSELSSPTPGHPMCLESPQLAVVKAQQNHPARTLKVLCGLSPSSLPLPQPSHLPLELGVGNGIPKGFQDMRQENPKYSSHDNMFKY